MRKFNLIIITSVLVVILLLIEILIIRTASDYQPKVNIVYAGVKIPQGTVIEQGMLVSKEVYANMAHPLSLRSIEGVLGKKAKMDIEEGEMVLEPKLTDRSGMQEVKLKDKNSRLFSVEFKADQANGWWLETGQYVDIIYVPGRNTDLAEPGIFVQRLNNIRVVALIDEKGNISKNSDQNVLPRYVCFEVSDEQDEFLAYAKNNGTLELSVIPK
ncbi:MAG: Flp pilus assembly protein CpaB [Acetivibrionales bacterium]|jgi:Flp pilus assembly protein CpaB